MKTPTPDPFAFLRGPEPDPQVHFLALPDGGRVQFVIDNHLPAGVVLVARNPETAEIMGGMLADGRTFGADVAAVAGRSMTKTSQVASEVLRETRGPGAFDVRVETPTPEPHPPERGCGCVDCAPSFAPEQDTPGPLHVTDDVVKKALDSLTIRDPAPRHWRETLANIEAGLSKAIEERDGARVLVDNLLEAINGHPRCTDYTSAVKEAEAVCKGNRRIVAAARVWGDPNSHPGDAGLELLKSVGRMDEKGNWK